MAEAALRGLPQTFVAEWHERGGDHLNLGAAICTRRRGGVRCFFFKYYFDPAVSFRATSTCRAWLRPSAMLCMCFEKCELLTNLFPYNFKHSYMHVSCVGLRFLNSVNQKSSQKKIFQVLFFSEPTMPQAQAEILQGD